MIRKVCFFLLVALALFYGPSLSSTLTFGLGGFSQSFPGPDLFSPVTDDIDLSGEDHLEFKWRRSDLVYTRSYDFRLYRGYQALAGNRILKKNIPAQEYPFSIPSEEFETGQVYTWVLIQVLNDGKKSDKSFSSFKIIKK